jgi:hypothetical protein
VKDRLKLELADLFDVELVQAGDRAIPFDRSAIDRYLRCATSSGRNPCASSSRSSSGSSASSPLVALCYITGNGHIVKGVRYTYLIGRSGPEIDDRDFFPSSADPADDPQPWPKSARYGKLSLTDAQVIALNKLNTVGFVVIKNDSLIFEEYFERLAR